MPGIVTSTTTSGSVKVYRAVFTSSTTSLAINWVTGSTATSTAGNLPQDKGVWVVFQNQSSVANVTICGADLAVNTQGIILGPLSTGTATQQSNSFNPFSAGSWSGIQMNDWWITSTSSVAACTAMLLKGV